MVNIANARLSFNHLILVTFAMLLLIGSGSTWARVVRLEWLGEETTLGNQDLDSGFSKEEATALVLGEIKKEESSQSQSQNQNQIQCIPPGESCVSSRNCCGDDNCCELSLPIPRCVKKTQYAQFWAANYLTVAC